MLFKALTPPCAPWALARVLSQANCQAGLKRTPLQSVWCVHANQNQAWSNSSFVNQGLDSPESQLTLPSPALAVPRQPDHDHVGRPSFQHNNVSRNPLKDSGCPKRHAASTRHPALTPQSFFDFFFLGATASSSCAIGGGGAATFVLASVVLPIMRSLMLGWRSSTCTDNPPLMYLTNVPY